MINILSDNISELVNNKVIFITGGTGTFGHEITKVLLNNYTPKKIIIFSRDEFKQYNMKQIFPEANYKNYTAIHNDQNEDFKIIVFTL